MLTKFDYDNAKSMSDLVDYWGNEVDDLENYLLLSVDSNMPSKGSKEVDYYLVADDDLGDLMAELADSEDYPFYTDDWDKVTGYAYDKLGKLDFIGYVETLPFIEAVDYASEDDYLQGIVDDYKKAFAAQQKKEYDDEMFYLNDWYNKTR